MKRFFALMLALGMVTAISGCEQKSKVEKKETVTTPEGTTTTTDTKTVEQSGDNPPAPK